MSVLKDNIYLLKWRYIGIYVASFICFVLPSSIALAAKGEGGTDKASGGLPQLNIETYPSQIFWLFVFFAILYLVFARNILPVISSTIQNRAHHIQDDKETAQKLTQEAEEAQSSYEQKLKQARSEASQYYKEAEADIEESSQKQWKEFRDLAAKEEAKLEENINQAKQEAMEEMTTIAAEIAQEAANKIVGIDMDIDAAKDAVQSLSKKGKAA